MAEANVGIRVSLLDSASAGLGVLNGALAGVGLRVSSLHGGMSSMDPTLAALGVTAGISGAAFFGLFHLMREGVDAAAELQSELLKVQLSVDGAGQHTQQLSQLMLELGSKTMFSSAQIADAFVAIGVKGLTAQDILGGVGEQAIYLAEAMGEKEAAGAASLLSQALVVFGGTAQDSAQYANDLLFAFRHGVNDVGDLSTAIQQAGAQAALMKIPFDEFTAALSFLGEAGLSGSKAGTSLRYMLASLADPTNKAQMELADLGVLIVNKTAPAFGQLEGAARRSGKAGQEAADNFDGTVGALYRMFQQAQKVNGLHTDETFFQWATKSGLLNDKLYDTNGNFVGIARAIQLIGQAMQNAPDQQKVAALQQLFSVRGGQGADEFLKNLPAALQALQQFQTQEANTSAQGDRAKIYNTEKGSLQGLTTTWKDWLAALGGADLGPITGGTQKLTKHLKDMIHVNQDGTYSLNAHGGAMVHAATALSGLTFAASSGGAVWMLLNKSMKTVAFDKNGEAIEKLTTPLRMMREGFGNLLSPLGKVFEWGGKLGTGAFWGPIGNGVKGLGTAFMNAGPKFFDWLDKVPTLGTVLKNAGKSFADFGPKLFNWVDKIPQFSFSGMLSGLKGLATGGFGALREGATTLVPALLGVGGAAAPVIGALLLIAGVVATVVLLFTTFRKQGDEIVGILKQAFGPAIQSVIGQFKSIVADVGKQWKAIQPQLKTAMDGLVGAFKKAEPTLKFFGALIGSTINIILGVLGGLVKGFLAVLPTVINVFSGIMNVIGGVGAFVQALFDGPNGWKKIPHIVKGIFGDLLGVIGNAVGAILGLAGNIVGGLMDGLTRGMQQIGGFPLQVFNAIVGGIKNLFGIKSPATQMLDIGGNILAGLRDGIMNAIPNLVSALGGIKDAIMNKVKSMFGIASPSRVMHELGTFLSLGLTNGIQSVDVASRAAAHFARVVPAISGVVSTQIRTPAMAAMMGNGQATTGGNVYHNHFEINGREVGRVVMDQFGNVLQMNGLARKMN